MFESLAAALGWQTRGITVNGRSLRPQRFIDLCNAARRRAGLPEKKERSKRRI